MAGLFRQPSTVSTTLVAGFKSTAGVLFSANLYKTESGNGLFAVRDNTIQIGKGTTPPTRQDFKLETPFTNGGIEDNKVLSGSYGYVAGSGIANQGTIISPTTGSGSITEVVKYFNGMSSHECIFMRNVITPVAFLGGDSINVEEEVLI